jgi:outer membrane biogenesis lipoprotein LolB
MRHLSLAAALLVAGCAAMPPPAPIPLEGLPGTFSVSGRVSVTQPGHGEIVRLHWSHATATDVWTVATPMGVEVARIERDGEGLVVHRPGASPMAAASFSDLTEKLLGAALDERLLVAWVHARPLAGPAGWQVSVDETQSSGSREVARRITAVRGEVTVKLVVDQYREGAP